MATTRYLCRILILDSEQAPLGQRNKNAITSHTDKKQFTIGSGPDADIRISGAGVETLHAQVTIDVPHLYIKNLSYGTTHVSTYQIDPENMEPFKSGEAIRLGQSKQVVFIELFRKFLEPHEESEEIVRDAYEKAKTIESLVGDHRRELGLLTKQALTIKEQTEKELAEQLERAQQQADEIHQSALQAKEDLLVVAEQDAALAAQKAEKEVERTINEIKLSSEEKTRKLVDQARQKAKEIKQEAEHEVEGILASSQREADLLIENAKNQAKDLVKESQRDIEALAIEGKKIQAEIQDYQARRAIAMDDLSAIKSDLKGYEDTRQQLERDFELEKERLRLSSDDLQKEIELQESTKRAIQAEVESFRIQFNKMTSDLAEEKSTAQKYLEKCKSEYQQTLLLKSQAQKDTEQIELKNKDLRSSINSLQTEHSAINQRVTELKNQEYKEREQMRNKLTKEHESRIEFEINWYAQQRLSELEKIAQEKEAKAKIEALRLTEQAQKISQAIQPLINQELVAQFGEEQSLNFKPQLEKIISPIVQRCVSEEYEFRRNTWEVVKPVSFIRELTQQAQTFKRQVGITTLSLLFLLAAIFVTWANKSVVQLTTMSSQSPPTATKAPATK